MPAALFGITNSNRDFSNESSWGKNIFNATFPTALICYMESQGIQPVYLKLTGDGTIAHDTVDTQTLFGAQYTDADLYFDFESRFEPLSALTAPTHTLDKIDLVTRRMSGDGELLPLRGLEVKLTVVPDSTTRGADPTAMGPELVVRTPTIEYIALSILLLYDDEQKRADLFGHLQDACGPVNNWSDAEEVAQRLPTMAQAIQGALLAHTDLQEPVVVQPIWRTERSTLMLADNCFDVFVWSNWAISRLFLDSTRTEQSNKAITRLERTTVWLAKLMWDRARGADVEPSAVFNDLTYGTKNDKAFSISGARMLDYLASPELTAPRITNLSLPNIILGDGQRFLSPERRLDGAISASSVFEDEAGDDESD